MDAKAMYQRLLAGLRRTAASRLGVGKIALSAGNRADYVGKVGSDNTRPTALSLLSLFEGLGVRDLGAYLRSQIAPAIDVAGLLESLPHPRDPPTFVKRSRAALRRAATLASLWPHIPATSPFLLELQEMPRARQPKALRAYEGRHEPSFVAGLVEWLDIHRYDRPTEAAGLARIAALELCPDTHLETLLRALAVYASSVRMLGSMTLAGMVLSEVHALAYRIDRRLEAEIIQRASYVIRDHARHTESLQASCMAASLYGLLGDHTGLARVSVDKGITLYLQGKLEAAEKELKYGLLWLPEEARRYRAAAHHALALGATERSVAKKHLELAEGILDPFPSYYRVCLCYTKANMARGEGKPERAEGLLREAKALADRFNVFDSALITLDLLALLVEQGRREETTEEALTVNALMQPLRLHPYAQESLRELARLNGRMTLQDIASARRAVRAARKEGTSRAEIL